MRSDYHHLYNTTAWRNARKAQLSVEPLCRMCQQLGRIFPAGVVDHIKPHRGDMQLFLDPENLQSLCKPCHDAHKQAQEHNVDGVLRGAGLDGAPIDLAHPWHRPVTGASAVSTALRGPSMASVNRADLTQGRGGQKSGVSASKTGLSSPLATPRYSQGGVT